MIPESLEDCIVNRHPWSKVWAPGFFQVVIINTLLNHGAAAAFVSFCEMSFHGDCDNLDISPNDYDRLRRGGFVTFDLNRMLYYGGN